MTKNWPDLIQRNIQPPETVSEAVDRLMIILEDDHKAAIAIMQEDELIGLHFGLGSAVRNAFKLHEPGGKLLADCNVVHPDDATEIIINKIWAKLKHGD